MENQFELGLYNPAKSITGFLIAFSAVVTLVAVGANRITNSNLVFGWSIGSLVGGSLLAYLLIKKWAKYKVVVTVGVDQVNLHYLNSNRKTTILFGSLLSYRYETFNGRLVLCFRLINSRKVKMVAHDMFGKVGDFTGLVQAVEQAVKQYRGHNTLAIIREKGFFEKRISTVILVAVTLLYGCLIWKIIHQVLPIRGSMITGLGIYIAYLGAWLAASKRRNQK